MLAKIDNKMNVGIDHMPPWRNRLARSAVNRKVGGSSPPGGETYFYIFIAHVFKRNIEIASCGHKIYRKSKKLNQQRYDLI